METHSRHRRHRSGGGRRRPHHHRGGDRHRSGGHRRNRHHGGSYNRTSQTHQPEAKGILGFIKKLFGLQKKSEDTNRSPRSRYSESSAERSSAPVREPEPIEVNSPRLYVGNLSYDTSESDLFDLFAQIGAVGNVEVIRDRQGNSKGFGFVEMQTLDTAQKAAERFNSTEFMGRTIVVNGAKS